MSKLINGDYSIAYPNFLGNQNLSSDVIVDSTTGNKLTTELSNITNELDQNLTIGTTAANTISVNSGLTTYNNNEIIKIKDNTVGALKFQCNDAESTDLMSISTLNGVESITINKHLELLGDVDAVNIYCASVNPTSAMQTNGIKDTNTTNSTSTITGGVITTGGVGIAKNLYVGQAVNAGSIVSSTITCGTIGPNYIACTGTTDSISSTTGSIICAGGVGISKNLYIAGVINNSNTTPSSTYATGAIVVAGGLGVGGQINCASSIIGGSFACNGNIQAYANSIFAGNITAGAATASSSTTTGAIITSGGVGIAGALNVGGSITSGTVNSTSFIGGTYNGSGSISGGQIFSSVGISLPTIDGSAAILNYYESNFVFPMMFQSGGSGGTTTTVNLIISRIGNIVNIIMPIVNINSSGAYIKTNSAYYLPTRFRPSAVYIDYCMHSVNIGTYIETGMINVCATGAINICKSSSSVNFGVGTGSGTANVFHMVYSI